MTKDSTSRKVEGVPEFPRRIRSVFSFGLDCEQNCFHISVLMLVIICWKIEMIRLRLGSCNTGADIACIRYYNPMPSAYGNILINSETHRPYRIGLLLNILRLLGVRPPNVVGSDSWHLSKELALPNNPPFFLELSKWV